ncbi:MAG: glycoside hydrolase family 97 protein [Acidobacteriota bacterium]
MSLIRVLVMGLAVASLSCDTSDSQLGVASPGGRVEVRFSLTETEMPSYLVRYDGKPILGPSSLSLKLTGDDLLLDGFEVVDVQHRKFDETYELVVGKSRQARNHYNEMAISLRGRSGSRLDLIFRAYDDGAAFRYSIPEQESLQDLEIVDEHTEFRFPAAHVCWALRLESFITNYESEFERLKLDEIGGADLIGLPLVVEVEGGPTLALTEANLTDYAAIYLSGSGSGENTLISRLSPLPDGSGVSVKASLPHVSPWRVIMIGDEPGDLIESNIVLNLNEPLALEDATWIQPGKAAWPWWSGRVVSGVNFEGGMNTATQKHYIDFASEFGLEYLLIDAGWYQRRPDLDITRTVAEIDLPEIISYAAQREVGVLLWLHWEVTADQMDKAFPVYEQWGIRGVKIDFMERDDQEMVHFYHRVAKKAAEHHLLVDFHGAYKPTGLRRTYPNLMTREGVLGLEHTRWSERITPPHNVTIPFTRMLAGPMDYTPGAFRNVTREQFQAQRRAATAMGTRCHQLAMFVVYESPLQVFADYPDAYRNKPGAEFLKVVPASWDETRAPAGEIGQYVVIARRAGDDWFIGAMTDWTPRSLELPLDFLEAGDYEATIYADAADSDINPVHLTVSRLTVRSSDSLKIEMAPGGGYAAHLEHGGLRE